MRVAELQMYRETAFERDGRHSNENAPRVYLQRPPSQAEADVADLYTIIIMSRSRPPRGEQSISYKPPSYNFGSSDEDDEERPAEEQSFVGKSRRRSSASFEFEEEEDSEEERPTSRRPSCRRDLDQSFRYAVPVEPQSSGSPRTRPPPPPPAPTAAPPPADSEEERPAKRRRPSKQKSADGPVRPPSSGPPRPRPPAPPATPPAPTAAPSPANSCPVCKLKIVNQDGSLQVVVQCVACAAKVHFECSGLQGMPRSGLKYLCPDHDTSRPDVAAKLPQTELRRIAEIMTTRKAGVCVKCREENVRYRVFWPSLQL